MITGFNSQNGKMANLKWSRKKGWQFGRLKIVGAKIPRISETKSPSSKASAPQGNSHEGTEELQEGAMGAGAAGMSSCA
jgi:hypothetical protein